MYFVLHTICLLSLLNITLATPNSLPRVFRRQDICSENGMVDCYSNCMPAGANCCNDGSGTYCDAGDVCVPDGCCPKGETCSGGGGTLTYDILTGTGSLPTASTASTDYISTAAATATTAATAATTTATYYVSTSTAPTDYISTATTTTAYHASTSTAPTDNFSTATTAPTENFSTATTATASTISINTATNAGPALTLNSERYVLLAAVGQLMFQL